jgi:hypothetical protein
MMRRNGTRVWALMFAAGVCAAAPGEPPPQTPEKQPANATPPSGDQPPANETPRRTEPVRRIKPTRDATPAPAQAVNPIASESAIPGLENTDLMLKAAPLRGEGTFLVRQRGSLVATPTGESAIVFHADANGARERPMVLLPCQTLQRMRKVVADRTTPTAFNVSGQVFVYLDLNYLLPTAYSIVGEESPAQAMPAKEERPAPDSATKRDEPPAKAGANLESDPQLQELIKSLEAQRERPRALGGRPRSPLVPGVETSKSAAGSSTASLKKGARAEGTSILRRRGRLVRAGDGQWSFVFDAGPLGDGASDAPITLMPCLTLQRMEGWASTAGESATFTVTGNVYLFEGRNYMMPAAYTINRPGDVDPRQ